jgi:hypothetical protein
MLTESTFAQLFKCLLQLLVCVHDDWTGRFDKMRNPQERLEPKE